MKNIDIILLCYLILSFALLNRLQNGYGTFRQPRKPENEKPQKAASLGVRDKMMMNWLMN